MDIAIVGANGDVGRQIATQLIARQLLTPRQRLQLVGRRGGASEHALYGLRADLYDAFAEITPEIDVALAPEEVAADLILFTAGATAPAKPGKMVTRDSLARTNYPVFDSYASALAENGHGEEVVIVITNPVELGVEVFARHLDRHRVIGMGGFQDTMRFRREIAGDLGMRRQRVLAYVLGEHGDGMIPIWSDLSLYGFNRGEMSAARDRVRGVRSALDFPAELAAAKTQLGKLIAQQKVQEAFHYAENLPPDLRCVILSSITHISGAKTAVSTAATTVDLAEHILSGQELVMPAQVKLLPGEFEDVSGVFGAPVVASSRGWTNIVEIGLDDDERQRIRDVSADINSKLEAWTHG